MSFASDLADLMEKGDADYLSVLDSADAYGPQRPRPPRRAGGARLRPLPDCVTSPTSSWIWLKPESRRLSGQPVDGLWLARRRRLQGRWQTGSSAGRVVGVRRLLSRLKAGAARILIWGVWHDARYSPSHRDAPGLYGLPRRADAGRFGPGDRQRGSPANLSAGAQSFCGAQEFKTAIPTTPHT